MSKKKLLIVIGAGASKEFDFPLADEVSVLFRRWKLRKIKDGIVLYNEIEEKIQNYYNLNSKEGSSVKKTNYEEILYILYYLDTLLDTSNYQNPILAFIKLSFFANIENKLSQYDFSNYSSLLIDTLLKYFRDKCKRISIEHADELDRVRLLLKKISTKYEIGIISLNYDNIFYQAKPDLFTGFDLSGKFQPLDVLKRQEWNFIYHLHGSVHFNMKGYENDLHKIFWENNLDANFSQNSFGKDLISTQEGIGLPNSVIIAGYEKANQIQRQPFRTYYSILDKLIHETDKFLIIGYSFADFHVNNALELIKENGKRNVVIINYSDDNQNPTAFRHDNFTCNLFKTIPANGDKMCTKNFDIPPIIAELKKNKEFEISKNKNYPLSIWHNGFMEICNNIDKLLDELD